MIPDREDIAKALFDYFYPLEALVLHGVLAGNVDVDDEMADMRHAADAVLELFKK